MSNKQPKKQPKRPHTLPFKVTGSLDKTSKATEAYAEKLFHEVQELEDARKTALANGRPFHNEALLRNKRRIFEQVRPAADFTTAYRTFRDAFSEESAQYAKTGALSSKFKESIRHLGNCLDSIPAISKFSKEETLARLKNNWGHAAGREKIDLLKMVVVARTSSFLMVAPMKVAKGLVKFMLKIM